MFSWDLLELNEEQSEAVLEPGNVFVRACPGSGKTRALTYKAAYELSKPDLGARFVAAITYTHRAADEITERIESLGVDVNKLWIGTIHSFCLEWIIRPYGINHDHLKNGYQVLDGHERENILTSICNQYRSLRVTHFDCEYFFDGTTRVATSTNPGKAAVVELVLDEYETYLRDNRHLDFEHMLLYAYELISSYPNIAKNLSRVFSIILVDEYQDTKEIQYQILSLILKAGEGVARAFIVGDPNQAIYGSMGGFPITVARFEEMTGLRFKQLPLKRNYRSSARIVDYFCNFRHEQSEIESWSRDRDYPSQIT